MKERSSPSQYSEKESSKEASQEWFPSDEELAAFEEMQEIYRDPGGYGDHFVPSFEEYFGRPDPRVTVYEKPADLPDDVWYPTDEELAAFEAERARSYDPGYYGDKFVPSFEDYFRRPDPRVKRMVRLDEVPDHRSETDPGNMPDRIEPPTT
jgi:hypothetical protein